MALESSLWQWLRNGVRSWLVTGELHLCRVENSSGEGFPDVEGCLRGASVLIELKTAARPKHASTPVNFRHVRPAQVLWHATRTRAGGRSWLLLQVGSGHEASRYLLGGALAQRVMGGMTEADLARYSVVGPACIPRQVVFAAAKSIAILA